MVVLLDAGRGEKRAAVIVSTKIAIMKMLPSASAFVVLLMAVTGCSSASKGGTTPPSETSVVGSWKVSPIPGRDANNAAIVTSWEAAFNADMTYVFTFNTVFAANASSFPGCTYSLTSSGGTWAAVTVNGSTGLRLSALQTHTTVRTGCTQASQNYTVQPATDSDPVKVVAGDYPYRISGTTLTITTGAGPLAFTHE